MIVSDLAELTIVNVFDRGEPNKERIVIQANETVEMAQFGLVLGLKAEGDSVIPLRDNFYWFGSGIVSRDQLIFVYTGPGEPVKSDLPGANIVTYSMHWGRPTTILNNREVVPTLIRINAITIAHEETRLLTDES